MHNYPNKEDASLPQNVHQVFDQFEYSNLVDITAAPVAISRIPVKSFMAGFLAKQKAILDIFQILTTTPVWPCRWRDPRGPEVGVPPPGVTSPATRAW